jgi:hypothetical protein
MKRQNAMILLLVILLIIGIVAPAGITYAEEKAKESTDSFTTELCYTRPYLLSLEPSVEMNVVWLTKDSSTARVEFGETEELGTTVEAKEYEIEGLRRSATPDAFDAVPENNPELPVFQEIATLTDLKPATQYFYRVITEKEDIVEESKIYNFETAPEADCSDFTFILLSDLQLKMESPATVKQAGQTKPDFIIYPGDLQNTPWKSSEWFPVEGSFVAEEEAGKTWFEIMQQEEDGTELLSYTPIFPTVGNHEIDDQRALTDKEFGADFDNWSVSIYMQLFRPLYPEQESQYGGKNWYSVDWGNLHISNITAIRWSAWDAYEFPGWMMFEPLTEDSEQIKWLREDLATTDRPYKWVSMHFHMMNRGEDVQVGLAVPEVDPDDETKVIYPEGDNGQNVLRPIYEEYGVCGVCFGHSHVYERYLIDGVNYIEAASIGNNYRSEDDPLHPTGIEPVVEFNDFRSFMHLRMTEKGIEAQGIQASLPESGEGAIGEVFDEFLIEANN